MRFDDLLDPVAGGGAADRAGPADVVEGSATHITEALAGYADTRVDHLIVQLEPPSTEAVHRLGRIAAAVRARTDG